MIDNKLREIAEILNIRFPISEFSKDLNFSMAIVSQYVNNKRNVSKRFIQRLEEFYNISYKDISNKKTTNYPNNKCEYEITTFDDFDVEHQQRYLNERSQHGWELVSVVQFTDKNNTLCFRFYFKRRS